MWLHMSRSLQCVMLVQMHCYFTVPHSLIHGIKSFLNQVFTVHFQWLLLPLMMLYSQCLIDYLAMNIIRIYKYACNRHQMWLQNNNQFIKVLRAFPLYGKPSFLSGGTKGFSDLHYSLQLSSKLFSIFITVQLSLIYQTKSCNRWKFR